MSMHDVKRWPCAEPDFIIRADRLRAQIAYNARSPGCPSQLTCADLIAQHNVAVHAMEDLWDVLQNWKEAKP